MNGRGTHANKRDSAKSIISAVHSVLDACSYQMMFSKKDGNHSNYRQFKNLKQIADSILLIIRRQEKGAKIRKR